MPPSPEILAALVNGQRVINYAFVASLSLLIYEWLANLPEEIEFIWKRKRWNLLKFLYLVSRYSPFGDFLNFIFILPGSDHTTCATVDQITCWLGISGMFFSELIILVRTHAIYGRSRKVLIALVGLTLGLSVLTFGSWAFWIKSWKWGSPLVPGQTGCNLADQRPVLAFLPFVGLCVFEIVIVIMTLYHGIKNFRNAQSPVIAQLYVDGVIFFVVLMTISISTIIIVVSAPRFWSSFPVKITRVLHSVLSCRIVLHLRAAAEVGPNAEISPDRENVEAGWAWFRPTTQRGWLRTRPTRVFSSLMFWPRAASETADEHDVEEVHATASADAKTSVTDELELAQLARTQTQTRSQTRTGDSAGGDAHDAV